jgi:hypothetical protein
MLAIMQRESSLKIDAQNPHSSASGLTGLRTKVTADDIQDRVMRKRFGKDSTIAGLKPGERLKDQTNNPVAAVHASYAYLYDRFIAKGKTLEKALHGYGEPNKQYSNSIMGTTKLLDELEKSGKMTDKNLAKVLEVVHHDRYWAETSEPPKLADVLKGRFKNTKTGR